MTVVSAPGLRHEERPRTDDRQPLRNSWAQPARRLGRALFHTWYDTHVHGTEHIPATGPVLVASNHIGLLDGPLLFSVSPRVVHALIKREMFDGRLGLGLRLIGQISVERQQVDPYAVKTCLRALRDGQVVAIYPEGSRGPGDVSSVHLGAAYLAMCTGAPIVPLAVLGTRGPGTGISHIPPRGTRLDAVFGEPIQVAVRPWPRQRADVAALSERLRVRLAQHVRDACALTGQSLPGPAPDQERDMVEDRGRRIGPGEEDLR